MTRDARHREYDYRAAMARRYIMNVVPHVLVRDIGVRSWLAGDHYILIVLNLLRQLTAESKGQVRISERWLIDRLCDQRFVSLDSFVGGLNFICIIYLFLFDLRTTVNERSTFSTC